jgi:hypothetical protein
MHREGQQLKEHYLAHAILEDEEEATLHRNGMCLAPSARFISDSSPPRGLGYLKETQ